VGEGGAVRMTIFQEQSSVKETTAAGTTNAGPSTTKRSIENTVVVDDGAILVLGGLIEDRFVTTKSKVPLLGDLPLLGGLFRSESRERRRTNLMVFLRPVVLRDAASSNSLSLDRYDQIRGEQKAAQPERSYVMPINESPVLPPLRAPIRLQQQESGGPVPLQPLGSGPLPAVRKQPADESRLPPDPSRAGYN
jgi:general secretion pathway protein D